MLVPQDNPSVTPTVNSVKVDAIDTDTQKTIQGITLNKIILNWLSFEYQCELHKVHVTYNSLQPRNRLSNR
jgi:hypothetical protein